MAPWSIRSFGDGTPIDQLSPSEALKTKRFTRFVPRSRTLQHASCCIPWTGTLCDPRRPPRLSANVHRGQNLPSTWMPSRYRAIHRVSVWPAEARIHRCSVDCMKHWPQGLNSTPSLHNLCRCMLDRPTKLFVALMCYLAGGHRLSSFMLVASSRSHGDRVTNSRWPAT
jgi:hypothetical protein